MYTTQTPSCSPLPPTVPYQYCTLHKDRHAVRSLPIYRTNTVHYTTTVMQSAPSQYTVQILYPKQTPSCSPLHPNIPYQYCTLQKHRHTVRSLPIYRTNTVHYTNTVMQSVPSQYTVPILYTEQTVMQSAPSLYTVPILYTTQTLSCSPLPPNIPYQYCTLHKHCHAVRSLPL